MKTTLLLIAVVLNLSLAFNQTKSKEIKPENNKSIKPISYRTFIHHLNVETSKLSSDLDRIIYIRKSVSQIINRGNGGNDISKHYKNWVNLSGENYYKLFEKNMTVKCGGAAHFLMKIYTDLGYKSITFDMGCNSTYTHQVTLVQSKENGKYYVQDAFYNVAYFLKKTKTQLDFASLIALLKEKEHRKILQKYEKSTVDIDTTGLYENLNSKNLTKFYKLAIKQLDDMSIKRFAKIAQRKSKIKDNCLKKSKLPKKNIYLFLIPLDHNSDVIKTIFRDSK